MRAVRIHELIGPSGLRVDELPDPSAGPGKILIDVRASGVNFPDVLLSRGLYQFKPPPPFSPGGECAGVVREVGAGVTRVAPGDRVALTQVNGTFVEKLVVAEDAVFKLPDAVSFEVGAATLLTYLTTYHALVDRAAIQAGETLLVLGAAGGVGTAAIQIGKVIGARVIAAASSDEKCDFCRTLGADATINYGSGNIRDELKKLTDGKGPDVVYDPVGGDLAEPVFRSIAWRGRYLVVGFAQGGIPALPLNLALLKGASIVGVFWGDFARREPKANAAGLAELARWYGEGKIKPVIDQRLPMSELPAAYARMGSRKVRGKLVMVNP